MGYRNCMRGCPSCLKDVERESVRFLSLESLLGVFKVCVSSLAPSRPKRVLRSVLGCRAVLPSSAFTASRGEEARWSLAFQQFLHWLLVGVVIQSDCRAPVANTSVIDLDFGGDGVILF